MVKYVHSTAAAVCRWVAFTAYADTQWRIILHTDTMISHTQSGASVCVFIPRFTIILYNVYGNDIRSRGGNSFAPGTLPRQKRLTSVRCTLEANRDRTRGLCVVVLYAAGGIRIHVAVKKSAIANIEFVLLLLLLLYDYF